ncbi:MAG: hypothetical protein HY854_05870 [Burkholderiales bacterium]|nr:hypothetical protein [Burkholderiales bacterium]
MRTPARCMAVALVWALLVATSLVQAQPATTVATTTYAYDEAGNKTAQVDALGRKTGWAFDAKSRVTGRTLPDGSQETFSYGLADNLLAHTTFAGEAFSFQYDVMNRRSGQVIPAGRGSNAGIAGSSVTYGYTPVDMLQSRQEHGPTTLDGLQTFRYDTSDRLLEAASPIGRISYAPDALGNVLERSVSGAGTVRYEYDDAGRMLKVLMPGGKQARYGYESVGRLAVIERDLDAFNGQPQFLRTSINYDAAGRVTLVAHVRHFGQAVTFVAGQRITRGPGGVIAKIVTDRADGSVGTTGQMTARVDVIQEFEYDGLARLAREVRDHSGGKTDTRYAYDLVGNRTQMTVATASGTDITTYTYDVADRLTRETLSLASGGIRSIDYTYDGNGNLASKSEPGRVTLYRFDPRNRLIDFRIGANLAAAQAAAPLARYAYDDDGNRIRKVGADARTYLVDTNHELPQVVREATGSEAIDYVRGIGLVRQARTTAAGVEEVYPLYGHLGSSLGAVNAAGDVVEQIDVDAFGNLDQATGLKQSHLYTGEYWDQDAQLLYLRARWYDPRTGRFISADPYEGGQTDPRSLNRYAYAHSDPVHNTDPSGQYSLGELNTSANIQLTAVRQAFLSGGKQAGGKALQQLGKIVEEGVEKLVKHCLKPGATITPKKTLTTTNGGAKAVIDFFVEMGGKVKNIEVKYQLPAGSSSGAFARAVKQLQAMIDKGEEGLLVAYKQLKTDARAKKMLDSVSGNAGTVQVVEGFLGLGAFLGEMVIEGCIK